MTVCGLLPRHVMSVRRAGALDRHLLSVSLCTRSLCDTYSHVFTVKPFSRSRLLEKNIIISDSQDLSTKSSLKLIYRSDYVLSKPIYQFLPYWG